MRKIHLICILDRSGSMSGLEQDTIGGYNSFLKKYEDHPKTSVSTILFDHAFTLLYDNVDVKDAKLSTSNYTVRGATALLDAIGHTVQMVKRKDFFEDTGEQRIYIITTDGMENASANYHYRDIHQLISNERSLGHEFVFLGANIDSHKEAEKLGINQSFTENFEATKRGTRTMFRKMHSMVDSAIKNET